MATGFGSSGNHNGHSAGHDGRWREARRIVSLVPSLTEALFVLGLGDRVVGVTEWCIHPEDRVASLPKVGGTKTPSVAKIVAAWMLTVLCAVMTFVVEGERERFLWGFGALFSVVSLGILWQFHWMLLNRNAVLRELKRLELQIASGNDNAG